MPRRTASPPPAPRRRAVLDDADAFWCLLLHRLLDKGSLGPAAAPLARLAGTPGCAESPLAHEVERIGANRLCDPRCCSTPPGARRGRARGDGVARSPPRGGGQHRVASLRRRARGRVARRRGRFLRSRRGMTRRAGRRRRSREVLVGGGARALVPVCRPHRLHESRHGAPPRPVAARRAACPPASARSSRDGAARRRSASVGGSCSSTATHTTRCCPRAGRWARAGACGAGCSGTPALRRSSSSCSTPPASCCTRARASTARSVLEAERRAYLRLARGGARAIVIDATREPDRVRRDVTAAIWAAYGRRWACGSRSPAARRRAAESGRVAALQAQAQQPRVAAVREAVRVRSAPPPSARGASST